MKNYTYMTTRSAILTACLLAIPLIAMQLTNEVAWTVSDFVIMGALIFTVGFMYELVSRKSTMFLYKAGAGITALTAFFLVWINLAVGVIGDDNPANLLYLVIAVSLFFASIAVRFRSHAMSSILFVTAAAQMMVPIVAVIFWRDDFTPGVIHIFVLNALFSLSWVVAGLLFRKAATESK